MSGEGARFCEECGFSLAVAFAGPKEQRKTVTVLFCDVTGSTALSETLDPERLRTLLAGYFERMKGIVESHGGSVEKFIGDAVMAVFGVPAVHEDDALRACRAAVEMREALPELGIEGRIGVMTGEVVTGTQERLATGDAVNVAARLEQAAEPGEVLLGQPTLALVGDWVEVEPLEPLELKGKAEPVPAYRLLQVRDVSERRGHARFVGRERELVLVREVWERVQAEQRCELLTVVGDAGVGKSRLVAEFLVSVEATVVRGRCLPYGEGITYWPVVEVLKQLELRASDEAATLALRSLLGESEAATSAEEIAWAFRKTLEQAASESPLVVVFDDIQWGEETLRDLIEHVALLSSGASVLLLCMARPELTERNPDWPVTLRLEPLADDEVEELISERVPEPLRDRIARAAGGNPLFIEEMLAMAGETDHEVVVPPTLRALLAARLDQLDPAERSVLERGAVEGEVFHRGAVQALAPEETQVTPRLAALVRKRLIRSDRTLLAGEDAFRFRHLLIRDAAYDALPKAARADLHRRLAVWLEQQGEQLVEPDEILGYHLEQVYRYRDELASLDDATRKLGGRAGELLTSAGKHALARDDVPAAVNLLERGVALLPRTSGSRDYVLLELAIALMRSGAFAAAEGALEEALALARANGDRRLELRTLLEREFFRIFTTAGTSAEQMTRVAEAAIPELEGLGDDAGLARAWHLLSEPPVIACRWSDRAAMLERALEHARRAQDAREAAFVAASLMQAIQLGPTPVDAAIARAQAFLREMQGDRMLTASIVSSLAVLLAMRGEFAQARAEWARARRLLDELGMTHRRAVRAIDASTIELLAGDAEAAERELRTGYRMLEEIGEMHVRPTIAAYLAAALAQEGRLADAAELARFAESHSEEDDIVTQAMWRVALAQVHAPAGESAEAERLAREAIELAEPTDFLDLQATALLALARVLREAGSPEAAKAALNAQAVYERKGNIVGAGWAAQLA